MEGILTRFLMGEILQDPFIVKAFFYTIFFLGAVQAIKLVHGLWTTGKIKAKGKAVEEKKGEWKAVIEKVVSEMKKISDDYEKRDARADKIYDRVQWLFDAHHKFDEQGIPIWYSKKSLELVMVKLSESIEKQTDTMGKISDELKEHRFCLRRIDDKVSGKPA